MPSVSVILPTFNRVRFLAPAIDSVLAQTHTDWEMIIADDGSGAQTRDYLRQISDPRVRVLWLTHSGNPARVRNSAIEAATGSLLAFLDSDDLWVPQKLERQLAAMRSRPGTGWSYCACRLMDSQGHPVDHELVHRHIPLDGWIFEPLLKLETAVATPTLVVERELARAVGGFDEQQHFEEHYDFCLRLALQSEVAAVPEPLCWIRVHDEHYSGDRIATQAGWMRLYEKTGRATSNVALQDYCARMRSQASLQLARLMGSQKGYRAMWSTLRGAAKFSWRYPRWWVGAVKTLARPALRAASPSARR